MELTLHIWRQKSARERGGFVVHRLSGISPNMSFIEMLGALNAQLMSQGQEPVAFEFDCLEGICGTCSLMINGIPHGPQRAVTTCQLHMRSFADGARITIEPWRVKAFPIIKDLIVDRGAFDRIIQAGGFISTGTGGAPDGNTLPVPKDEAETAMDAAQCIGCGACAAACKNGSAMLFTAAKAAHFAHLPQGQPERSRRALAMVAAMDKEGFGACSLQTECEAACPKEISVRFIAELNRDYRRAGLGF
jgi:succinate dehydrogenase / fumarate reductase iron-sulfur subunit